MSRVSKVEGSARGEFNETVIPLQVGWSLAFWVVREV
jgi:hypothetical protein